MKLTDKLAIIERETERCPHLIGKRAGDEVGYFCRESERLSGSMQQCQLEYGGVCEIWDELREEDGS